MTKVIKMFSLCNWYQQIKDQKKFYFRKDDTETAKLFGLTTKANCGFDFNSLKKWSTFPCLTPVFSFFECLIRCLKQWYESCREIIKHIFIISLGFHTFKLIIKTISNKKELMIFIEIGLLELNK